MNASVRRMFDVTDIFPLPPDNPFQRQKTSRKTLVVNRRVSVSDFQAPLNQKVTVVEAIPPLP